MLSMALIPTLGVVPVQLYAYQRAIAGAAAYCAATLVSSPVDVVKCRMQLKKDHDTQRGLMPLMASMLKKEGPLVFFSGLGPALLMAPAAMVQYTLMDPLRSMLPLFAAAIIAGTLDICIKTPFERLKTQLQSGCGSDMSTLMMDTWRAHGVRGLWAGLGATLVRDVPYLVFKWLTYVYAQGFFASFGLSGTTVNLAAGAAAGTVAATIVTPADVIKTRLQVADATETPMSIGRGLWQEGGIPAFFCGLGPRLMRIPLYTSITLATFDFVKDSFLHAEHGLKSEL